MTKEYTQTRQEIEHTIVENMMGIASFEGWSEASLMKAAVAAGYEPLEAKRLFPNGVADALSCYSHMLSDALIRNAGEAALDELPIRERIAWLVMERLTLMEPHREAIRRAVAYRMMPWFALDNTRDVWEACDVMWRLAGDQSTDFNYYTKRGLLAKVYVATLCYWLYDDSDHLGDTGEFLRRRIDQVLVLGKYMGQSQKRVATFVETVAQQCINRTQYKAKRR